MALPLFIIRLLMHRGVEDSGFPINVARFLVGGGGGGWGRGRGVWGLGKGRPSRIIKGGSLACGIYVDRSTRNLIGRNRYTLCPPPFTSPSSIFKARQFPRDPSLDAPT
jgi:hypothetical protein